MLHLCQKINGIMRQFHEPILPIGDPGYGGITGSILPSPMVSIIWEVQNMCEEYSWNPSSIFIDLGSGMGFPVLCASCLNIKRCIGVEFSNIIINQAEKVYTAVKDYTTCHDVLFYNENILNLSDIYNSTHIYSFTCGMPPEIISKILYLCSNSNTSKLLIISMDNPYVTFLQNHRILYYQKLKISISNTQRTCYFYVLNDEYKKIIMDICSLLT